MTLHAPTPAHAPGPYARTAKDDLHLGIPGFRYPDLFDPARLAELHAVFDRFFAERAPEAHAQFEAYRACLGEGMTPEQRSEALLAATPHVSAFVGKLFGVEREMAALKGEVEDRDPLWRFKRDFAKKRVLRDGAGKAFEAAHGDHAATRARAVLALVAAPGLAAGKDEELAIALGTNDLVAIDDVARKAKKAGGASWTDDLRARADRLATALATTPELSGALPAADPAADDSRSAVVGFALDAIELALALRRRDPHDPAARWTSLKAPKNLDYAHLVHLRRPDPKIPELFVGEDEHRRQRKDFKLTDKRGTAREVESEVDYCLYCHNRDKDSCSKGFRDPKAGPGAFKKNPLGVDLRGCPLEEKISEMHTMRRDGDSVGALALVTLDNPMCPGTGHRICNDCMKACIFQKQEPVNIPQIETRVLTEVLSLPWGLEIYGLLTRWNPLHVKRPYMLPYNGKNVMVVGLGPAGYTLAHHLACEGFGVVAVDGLKVEPLPFSLTGGYVASDGSSPMVGVPSTQWIAPEPVRDALSIYGKLDERILLGFGGVSEYGITVRWDKNFLTLVYMMLARSRHLRIYGGVRFGGTIDLDDAWNLGIDHVAIAAGAGRPTLIDIKNNLARGIRKASDFLMALQLTGAYKKSSLANLQVSLPAIVIGGGLTAIDTATELLAYYLVQIDKTVDRFEALERAMGRDALRKLFDDEEWGQLEEHLAHGRALRAEKELADREKRVANVQKLLDAWGGVTLVYRKSLGDSPAYRLNHEEVEKSLEEGVRYIENMSPLEALVDDRGQVQGMRFQRKDGTTIDLPAKTVCVAAGTSPNVTYEKEHQGSFQLDKRGQYFQAHKAELVDGKLTVTPATVTSEGFFTNYAKDGHTVSFYGDNHPYYAGSVVKAMASAKDGYPHVAALFPETKKLDPKDQPARDKKLRALYAKLDAELLATVVAVNRLTKTIVEVVVHAPLAARKFSPGQFYRLQNFETRAKVVDGTRLAMEGLALTGAWVDVEKGLMGTIVLEMGGSSRLCAALEPGEPIVLMGPTGAPTEIAEKETVLLAGGGLGNAVLFSIARAFKAHGSKIIYFAGYKDGSDVFKMDDIEAATDQVVWATDAGVEVTPRRPQDVHFRGNIVQAMIAYGKGELGTPVAKLSEVNRIIAIGSDRMMAAVKDARHGVLQPLLNPKHLAIGSINSPMQCMMKEVCAQCLQKHVDPRTGKETVVFTCFNQDQDLDSVDFGHLRQRLRLNSMQEKLANAWFDHLLQKNPGILRV
jgi:NADPH-dependent glutamate synthase beta subunit-like oxidoreductase/NAD(P)H-flavin reductase